MNTQKDTLKSENNLTAGSSYCKQNGDSRAVVTRLRHQGSGQSAKVETERKRSLSPEKYISQEKKEMKGSQQKDSHLKIVDTQGNSQSSLSSSETDNSIKSPKGKDWSERDDRILKNLILFQKQYDWETLGKALGARTEEVIQRWQQSVYPNMKSTLKVGGALKWSFAEDSILIGYEEKFGFEWADMLKFLPQRTIYSLEGRWRRITKNMAHFDSNSHRFGLEMPNETRSTNKYQHRKHIIRLIASIAEGRNRIDPSDS